MHAHPPMPAGSRPIAGACDRLGRLGRPRCGRAEARGDLEAGAQAVLVEPVPAVAAAEPGAAHALHRRQRRLRLDGRPVVLGMVVDERSDPIAGLLDRVQRHEHRALGVEVLQQVHPVGERDAPLGAGPAALPRLVVPARPGPAPPRHRGGVVVEHGQVLLVGERPQQVSLLRRGVASEHRQGGVGVRGDDHVVESFRASLPVADQHRVGFAHHRIDRRRETDVVERRGDPAHVLTAPARHRAPLRTVPEIEQSVVVEEAGHRRRGVGEHLPQVRGPDARDHGQQEVVAERRRVAGVFEPVARGLAGFPPDQRLRLAAEPHDLADHPPVRRSQQVRRLRQHAENPRAVLERSALRRDRERHVAGLGRDAVRVEQPHEVRVVPLVVDDEAGVDGHGAAAVLDLHGVGVSSEAFVGFEHRDLVAPGKGPGGAQPRDSTTDHGDPHVDSSSRSSSGAWSDDRCSRLRARPGVGCLAADRPMDAVPWTEFHHAAP